jgi:hypothetical protein
MASSRPIPSVPTEVSPELEAAANEEYEAYLASELAAAEQEPFEGISLEQCWVSLCEKHRWLAG